MRVRVGEVWYEPKPGQPIMVELTPADKANIANMVPEATKYGLFDDPNISRAEMEEYLKG